MSAVSGSDISIREMGTEMSPIETVESGIRKRYSDGNPSDSVSQTSTIIYEQTTFEVYRVQVEELCHLLWPSIAEELHVDRFFGICRSCLMSVLRTTKLRGSRLPSPIPRKFYIERLSGGSFN